MKKWILALLLVACAHHAKGLDVSDVCRDHGDANACIGWAMDLVYLGAGDRRYDDPALAAYVGAIATKIGRAAGLDHVRVRLLDDEGAEASALGGDIVYVHRGILARLDDEAELAALLGHEVTHLLAKHTADLVHSDEDALMSDEERLRRRDDDEALADERAVAWVTAAGYDPSAVLDMMRAIQRNDDGSDPAPGLGLDRAAPEDDHPPVSIRLARIARMVAGRRGGARNRAAFLAHVEGLVVGEDPRRGRVEHSTWIHAASGLAIDLPRSWKASGSEALELTSPDGATINVSAVARSWADLLREVVEDTHTRTIAGRETTIGTVKSTQGGDAGDPKITINADALGTPTAIVDDGEHVLVIGAGGTHARARLDQLLALVRPATRAELDGAPPHRLHLRAAPRDGTVAQLAKTLCKDPAASRALDDPTRRVAAGDPIKCVE